MGGLVIECFFSTYGTRSSIVGCGWRWVGVRCRPTDMSQAKTIDPNDSEGRDIPWWSAPTKQAQVKHIP